jgi:hypothetical protein
METTEIKAALARLEEKDKKKKAAEIEWPTEYVILYFYCFYFLSYFFEFFLLRCTKILIC